MTKFVDKHGAAPLSAVAPPRPNPAKQALRESTVVAPGQHAAGAHKLRRAPRVSLSKHTTRESGWIRLCLCSRPSRSKRPRLWQHPLCDIASGEQPGTEGPCDGAARRQNNALGLSQNAFPFAVRAMTAHGNDCAGSPRPSSQTATRRTSA